MTEINKEKIDTVIKDFSARSEEHRVKLLGESLFLSIKTSPGDENKANLYSPETHEPARLATQEKQSIFVALAEEAGLGQVEPVSIGYSKDGNTYHFQFQFEPGKFEVEHVLDMMQQAAITVSGMNVEDRETFDARVNKTQEELEKQYQSPGEAPPADAPIQKMLPPGMWM